MKRLIVASGILVSIVSCSLNTSFLGGKSEAELVDGFEYLEKRFDQIFDENYNADSLVFIHDSLKVYQEVLSEKFPECKFLPELIFDLGETAMKLKDGKQAIQYFEQLMNEFPQDEEVSRAAYFIAYTYQEVIKDEEKAVEAYKKVYKSYPDSKWAENAKNQVLFLNNPSFIGE